MTAQLYRAWEWRNAFEARVARVARDALPAEDALISNVRVPSPLGLKEIDLLVVRGGTVFVVEAKKIRPRLADTAADEWDVGGMRIANPARSAANAAQRLASLLGPEFDVQPLVVVERGARAATGALSDTVVDLAALPERLLRDRPAAAPFESVGRRVAELVAGPDIADVPKMIGPYEILAPAHAGRGVSGYRARAAGTVRYLKVIEADAATYEPDVARRIKQAFERQYEIWQAESEQLPSLVPIVDKHAIADPQQLDAWLVLEYVWMHDRPLVDEEPVELAEALRLLGLIADPVGTLNSRGRYLRALSPESIYLVGEDVRIDGLTFLRIEHRRTVFPALYSRFAPTAYVAPEARTGQAVHGSTDVFSLAGIALNLLTGAEPDGEHPSASSALADVPPALRAVLAGALGPPDERPPTAHEFVEDIAAAIVVE